MKPQELNEHIDKLVWEFTRERLPSIIRQQFSDHNWSVHLFSSGAIEFWSESDTEFPKPITTLRKLVTDHIRANTDGGSPDDDDKLAKLLEMEAKRLRRHADKLRKKIERENQ
jgi:hypothetical protein